MSNYLIGIDGGGSHTEGVLCSDTGDVIKSAVSGPSSATGTEFPDAIANISAVISTLIGVLPQNANISCLFAGISGCGGKTTSTRYANELRKAFPKIGRIEVGSDTFNPAYAANRTENVVVAVCGTGSVAYAMTKEKIFRIDGYGYLFGDDASGFAIGRKVLNSIFRYHDGRGEYTILEKLFCEREETQIYDGITTLINNGGKQKVASYAPLAFEAAALGDKIAISILDNVVDELCLMIRAASKRIDTSPKYVVTGGSIWTADSSRILQAVKNRLGNEFYWCKPTVPIAFGAAKYAAKLAGIENLTLKKIKKERGK